MRDAQLDQYAALVPRVSLGILFVAHGLLKLLVFTLPGKARFFERSGLPGLRAYAAAYFEVVGRALLLSGVATPQLALLFLPILFGALWVHVCNGWVFSNPHGGWQFLVFLIAATIVQALLGNGAYALTLFRRPAPGDRHRTVGR